MVGATAAISDISFRLPLGSVDTGQATVTFPDSRSTTESKLINAWPSFLLDHARRLVHLLCILTNAERSRTSAELDKLTTNGKDDTPLSVTSPSSGTAHTPIVVYSVFNDLTVTEQSAPGTTKTTSDATV